MPFRSDQPDLVKAAPLDYVKYALGVLAALLLVPAILQGALAFLQTFLQTLLSIVLTLNLLLLSAVAGVVGVWVWQRRIVGDGVVPIALEIDPTATPSSRDPVVLVRDPLDAHRLIDRTPDPSSLPQRLEVTPTSHHTSHHNPASPSPASGLPSPSVAAVNSLAVNPLAVTSSHNAIPVTIPDVASEMPRSTSQPATTLLDRQASPEPLIQAQLARRLGVSSSTIGVRKLKPDFEVWSRQKDPAGLAWRYCEEARQFVVVST
jgi:hypothetical protein